MHVIDIDPAVARAARRQEAAESNGPYSGGISDI